MMKQFGCKMRLPHFKTSYMYKELETTLEKDCGTRLDGIYGMGALNVF